MDTGALLSDLYGRVRELVPPVVEGLSEDDLAHRPGGTANPIAWLVWHLARVQDASVGAVAGTDEVWTAGGWRDRFGLDLPADDTGYGHGSDDVAKVRASADLLAGYADEVAERTERYVRGLTADGLDRVVDESYDPVATLGVRLVSVAADCLQHAGQAAYARGLLQR